MKQLAASGAALGFSLKSICNNRVCLKSGWKGEKVDKHGAMPMMFLFASLTLLGLWEAMAGTETKATYLQWLLVSLSQEHSAALKPHMQNLCRRLQKARRLKMHGTGRA